MNIFSQAVETIDGSKFKAVNVHDCNFKLGKLKKLMQEINLRIEHNLTKMDTADR